MKKLKKAIATFILQGKDCWDKLDTFDKISLNRERHADEDDKEFVFDRKREKDDTLENLIQKLMPCFFDE